MRRIALLTLLLAVPCIASASSMPGPGGTTAWNIYAFANGNVLYGVLTAASALVKNSEFRSFLLFMCMLRLMGTIVAALGHGLDGRRLAGPFIAATTFLTAGLGVTTNVVITDTVTGYTNVVKNVPVI